MICDQGNVQPQLPYPRSFLLHVRIDVHGPDQLGRAWPLHLMQTNETLWNELILRMINTSNAKSSPQVGTLIVKRDTNSTLSN